MPRPKLKREKDRKHSLTVTITKKEIKLLRDFGDGNASAGVRKLLLELIQRKKEE